MLRVLHGPVNVGNQAWILSRHERKLGVRSDLVVNHSDWLGYSYDRCLSQTQKKSLADVARRSWFGLSAAFRYDVLHYYFGRSFLRFVDLKLARRLGHKIFMTLQGCDVRLSDVSAKCNSVTPCREGYCNLVPVCRATLDGQRRQLIEDILPLADRVFVLNPELAHYVPGATFLPYASAEIEAIEPCWPRTSGPAVILHAPTDESIKGSALIMAAVEHLKRKYPVELLLVKDVPHSEALRLYRQADLVIDQVLAGWYGGLAVEAMALGKPVACYIRQEDLVFVPTGMRTEMPIIRVTPATLEADLEAVLAAREQWPAWGKRARNYVLRWHNPRRIAAAMVRAYLDPASRFELTTKVQASAA